MGFFIVNRERVTMTQLAKGLQARHMRMIALGGSLGTGLFLTSGSALSIAGPGGALLAYGLMGFIVYFLMNSLGEMSAYKPSTGSFCQHANDYVDPAFGYAMSCNYWFNWAITIAVELVAAAIVMEYWFPHVNPAYWCVLFFIGIVGLNTFSVKVYGEAEYWLSGLKVVAILAFIGFASWLLLSHPVHSQIDWRNWTIGDGPFHGGWKTFLQVFLLSGFAFQGTELIGTAAGEADNPSKSIPAAIRQVFWRIILFYIVTMLLISLIIPYVDPRLLNAQSSVSLSPFTIVMNLLGFHHIAGILNFIILIALLSACNSDTYSASRVLWHMADIGTAPKIFGRVNRFGVPIYALLASALFGAFAFISNYVAVNSVFLWLVNVSSLAGFVAWIGISVTHYYFRRDYLASGGDLAKLPYRAKWFPLGPIIAFVSCVFIVVAQPYLLWLQHSLNWQNFTATYIGIPIVGLFWLYKKYRP